MGTTLTEQQIMEHVAQRLAGAHPGIEPEQVSRTVNEEYERFAGRPIRDFIPLFVERNAADRLSRLVAQK